MSTEHILDTDHEADDWPEAGSFGDASAARFGFVAALGVAAAVGLVEAVVMVRGLLLLIFLAAFIAVGLDPVVGWLCARGLRRVLAVTVVGLGVALLLGGFVAAVVPAVSAEARVLVAYAPTYVGNLQRHNAVFARLNEHFHIVDQLRAAANGAEVAVAGGLLGVGEAVVSTVFATLTVIVLTLYFLVNLPSIKRLGYRLLPRDRRVRVGLLSDEALDRVGRYLVGRLILALAAGGSATVFLTLVGVPYSLALGMLAALLDLVPIIGSLIAGVVIVLVALAVSVPVAVAAVVFFVVYRLLEDYLVAPAVMSRTVHVPSLVQVVAVFLGTALFGVIGAVVATPIAAAIELVLTEVVFPRLDAT
jgi:predicted PurR-regulated permease PerM